MIADSKEEIEKYEFILNNIAKPDCNLATKMCWIKSDISLYNKAYDDYMLYKEKSLIFSIEEDSPAAIEFFENLVKFKIVDL